MKVLLISTSECGGGGAIAARRLMDALTANGVKTKMMVRDKQSNDKDVIKVGHKLPKFLERLSILPHTGFNRSRLWQADIANTGFDITRTKEFQEADIIHLHWINQGFLSLNTIQKILRCGKPVVWTLHDMWEFTGICHYPNECEKYRTECEECPLLRSQKRADLANKIFRKKIALYQGTEVRFVAVSSWLANCAKESRLLYNQSVEVIPNVLPLSRFVIMDKQTARKQLGLPEDKIIIAFGAVNIDDGRKGLVYLNQALRLLIERGTFKKEQLHIALFGGLKRPEILEDIPVSSTYLGFVDSDNELPALYNSADVAAIPSRYETFGQTVIEAQACGCTPVTFTGSGQMDIITHKQNGYLTDYLSAEDFANGLQWAISHPVDKAVMRCQLCKLIQNMRGNQHRDIPLTVQLQDQLTHLDDALRVQPVDRLIEHKEIGTPAERNRNAEALPHPERKILCLLPACAPEPDQIQQLRNTGIIRQSQQTVLLLQVRLRRQLRKQRRRFDDRTHSPAGFGDFAVAAGDAVDLKFARRRKLQAADQTDQRGLSGAVPADKAVDRALRHIHRQTVQRLEMLVAFTEIVCFQNTVHNQTSLSVSENSIA